MGTGEGFVSLFFFPPLSFLPPAVVGVRIGVDIFFFFFFPLEGGA
jgi:hypothetical protein